jgi:hypothetical protein
MFATSCSGSQQIATLAKLAICVAICLAEVGDL